MKKPQTKEYSLASKNHKRFICLETLLLYFQYLGHTGQFIISKLPASMDSTNRSVVLGLFLFCKCIGNYKSNCHVSINFCLGPLRFGHTSNYLLALWSVNVWPSILATAVYTTFSAGGYRNYKVRWLAGRNSKNRCFKY